VTTSWPVVAIIVREVESPVGPVIPFIRDGKERKLDLGDTAHEFVPPVTVATLLTHGRFFEKSLGIIIHAIIAWGIVPEETMIVICGPGG
jgi:hypothetical protein